MPFQVFRRLETSATKFTHNLIWVVSDSDHFYSKNKEIVKDDDNEIHIENDVFSFTDFKKISFGSIEFRFSGESLSETFRTAYHPSAFSWYARTVCFEFQTVCHTICMLLSIRHKFVCSSCAFRRHSNCHFCVRFQKLDVIHLVRPPYL